MSPCQWQAGSCLEGGGLWGNYEDLGCMELFGEDKSRLLPRPLLLPLPSNKHPSCLLCASWKQVCTHTLNRCLLQEDAHGLIFGVGRLSPAEIAHHKTSSENINAIVTSEKYVASIFRTIWAWSGLVSSELSFDWCAHPSRNSASAQVARLCSRAPRSTSQWTLPHFP